MISFDGLDWLILPIDTDITQETDNITIPSGKTLEISSYIEGGDGAEPEAEEWRRRSKYTYNIRVQNYYF